MASRRSWADPPAGQQAAGLALVEGIEDRQGRGAPQRPQERSDRQGNRVNVAVGRSWADPPAGQQAAGLALVGRNSSIPWAIM